MENLWIYIWISNIADLEDIQNKHKTLSHSINEVLSGTLTWLMEGKIQVYNGLIIVHMLFY